LHLATLLGVGRRGATPVPVRRRRGAWTWHDPRSRFARIGRRDARTPARGGPYHAVVQTSVLARLQVEDLVLVGWTALAWPLLRGLFPGDFGADAMFDPGHLVRGIVWTASIALAFVVIASHDADPADSTGSGAGLAGLAGGGQSLDARLARFGPLVGGMGFIAAGGFAGLGLDRDLGFALVFLGLPILFAVSSLKSSPALPHETRRWLLTPFFLVAASFFNDFVRSIGLGPDLLRDLLGGASKAGLDLGQTLAAVAGGLSLFVLGAAVFYAMLVAVPRGLIDPERGLGTWTVRFAAYVAGSLTGIGLLAGFGF
jgi:hypothetical protein